MSITLYLLNKKGYYSLKFILNNPGYAKLVEKVITAEDKGNKEDYCDEIIELCKKNNIKVFKRNDDFKVGSDYALAIGWRWLINGEENLLVIHDSLLPKYRGFAPLPNMLINGEEKIGASAIYATDEMDKGDIIFSESISVEYPIKIAQAIEKVSNVYIKLVFKIFSSLVNNKPLPRLKQNEDEATYSLWRNYDDYFIDWNQSALEIERFVNAVGHPYDGAKTRVNDEIVTILKVKAETKYTLETVHPGKILLFEDECPIVVCGVNAVKIIEVVDSKNEIYKFKNLRITLK